MRYRLLEQASGLRKRIVVHSVQQVECLQHEFVSGQILGMLAHRPYQLPLTHLRRDLSYNTDGNPILKSKQFVGVAFVQIRTNDLSGFGITEFGHDTDSRHRPLYPSIEHVTNAELTADLTHVNIAAAKAKAGPSRYDEELLEPG